MINPQKTETPSEDTQELAVRSAVVERLPLKIVVMSAARLTLSASQFVPGKVSDVLAAVAMSDPPPHSLPPLYGSASVVGRAVIDVVSEDVEGSG